MAEVTPPLVLEGGAHASHLVRQLWGDTYTPGVIGSGHLNVTEQGTPALGVTVAAGRAVVAGSEASDQGVYYVANGAARDVGLATADATNDRIDLIVARVLDSFYSGADDEWELQAVTGVPAAVPVAPAAPANSLVLAEVEVPADAGGNPAITNSEITDRRVRAAVQGGILDLTTAPAFGGLPVHIETIGPTTSVVSSITFTNIPQDFRHLLFQVRARTNAGADDMFLRINNNSGASDYRGFYRRENGAGTVTRVTGSATGIRFARLSTSAIMAAATLWIPDYSATTRPVVNASGHMSSGTADADQHLFQAGGGLLVGSATVEQVQFLIVGGLSFGTETSISIYGLPA